MIRLLTNLSYVSVLVPDALVVRTNTAALLLEGPGLALTLGDKRSRVRGCGPDRAWPVFDIRLGCGHLEYEVKDYETGMVMLTEGGEEKPIGGGSALAFADGTWLLLDVEDHERPVRVDELADDDYDELWRLLERGVRDHWTAPNMPYLSWAPAEALRGASGRGAP